MKCTGSNAFGQLGYGDAAGRGVCSTPLESLADLPIIDLGTDFNISQIQTGQNINCVLSDRDVLKCFGYNGYCLSYCRFLKFETYHIASWKGTELLDSAIPIIAEMPKMKWAISWKLLSSR